jgi:D-sedoheptulose 7-phosphate isomerase
MTPDAIEFARGIFERAVIAHENFLTANIEHVVRAAEAIGQALATGHKVIAFGNGGSAGDAEHLVAELVGRFEIERTALPGIALTADSSVMTAIANDYGYETVFTRQIEAFGHAADVAVGITTSGRSPNVVAGLTAARQRGLRTIALTGRDGGQAGQVAHIHINVAEQSTARAQEVHRTVLHAICALVDRRLAVNPPQRVGRTD